jgi:hypothetical protein
MMPLMGSFQCTCRMMLFLLAIQILWIIVTEGQLMGAGEYRYHVLVSREHFFYFLHWELPKWHYFFKWLVYLYLFDRAKIKLMKPLNSSYYYYYYYYYCAESPLGKNNCQGYTTLGFSEVHSGMLPWWCGSSRRNNRYWSHFVVRSRPAKMEIVDPMNSNSISTIVLRRSVTFVITATYYVSLYISWICSSR